MFIYFRHDCSKFSSRHFNGMWEALVRRWNAGMMYIKTELHREQWQKDTPAYAHLESWSFLNVLTEKGFPWHNCNCHSCSLVGNMQQTQWWLSVQRNNLKHERHKHDYHAAYRAPVQNFHTNHFSNILVIFMTN